MEFVTWIIIGLFTGLLTGFIVKGNGYASLGDSILGVIGALVGGFFSGLLLHISGVLPGFRLITVLIVCFGAVAPVVTVHFLPSRPQT